jgi:HlyD family secretion protein
MSAPTLFVIAADLSRMQVNASIDESDVGMIHEGQPVTFRVGAFPDQDFFGTLRQLRLNPTVAQNVVTYTAVIDVPNNGLKLKPGMTATTTIEIARKDNVLRIPNAALQYRPTSEALALLNKDAGAVQAAPSKTGRQIWAETNGRFTRVPVMLGLSDGTNTELLSGDLAEGTKAVTGVTLGVSQQQTRAASGADPFSSLQQGRGFSGGPRP